jgi:exonuclease VII small subunit
MATFPTFPAIDLSGFDLTKLDPRKLDLGKLDLGKLDLAMPTIDLPGIDGEQLAAALRDAAYITIGFGVLTFQQAQVRRRELVATLSNRFGASKTQIDDLLASFEQRLAAFDKQVEAMEAQLDKAIAGLEQRLPDQAAALVGQAHDVAKLARRQVRGLLRSAA